MCGEIESPVEDLYRVGRTLALRGEPRDVPVAEAWRRVLRRRRLVRARGLAPAIASLSEAQRCAVGVRRSVSVNTLREAAEVLGVTASTVHRDSERALARLRSELEVENAH